MTKVVALLFADSVREEITGKLSVIGIYADTNLKEKPLPNEVSVFSIVTDIEPGDHDLSLRIVNHAEKKAVRASSEKIKCDDRGEYFYNIMRMPAFEFPSSGVYSVHLLLDGESVGKIDFQLSFPEGA